MYQAINFQEMAHSWFHTTQHITTINKPYPFAQNKNFRHSKEEKLELGDQWLTGLAHLNTSTCRNNKREKRMTHWASFQLNPQI